MGDQNNNNEEDAEAMRASFEAFMLQGKNQPQQKKDDTESLSQVPSSSSNKSKKKKKKKHHPQQQLQQKASNIGSSGTSPIVPPTRSSTAQPPTPTTLSASVSCPDKLFGGRSPRDILVSFYQTHNPTKMNDIDKVLTKYAGNEEQLFRNLAMKYNLDLASIFAEADSTCSTEILNSAPASNSEKQSTMASSSRSGSGTPLKASTGSINTPTKAKIDVESSNTSPKPSSASNSKKQSTPTIIIIAKTDKKRYYQHLRTFTTKVQHTWLVIDNQLYSVLQNVVSIRGRLPLEYKLLQGFGSDSGSDDYEGGCNPQDDTKNNNNHNSFAVDEEWKYHGLQGKPKHVSYSSLHLHSADVHLALANDVTQHEKMLVNLRSLMTNLAECNDALGRALDNLWKFHLECIGSMETQLLHDDQEDWRDMDDKYHDEVLTNTTLGDHSVGIDEIESMEDLVQSTTEVYQMLSSELYRKQKLIPLILESTQDDLLGVEQTQTSNNGGKPAHGDRNGNGLGGLQIARRICKSWLLSSEESCVDERRITYLLKLGEMPQAK